MELCKLFLQSYLKLELFKSLKKAFFTLFSAFCLYFWFLIRKYFSNLSCSNAECHFTFVTCQPALLEMKFKFSIYGGIYFFQAWFGGFFCHLRWYFSIILEEECSKWKKIQFYYFKPCLLINSSKSYIKFKSFFVFLNECQKVCPKQRFSNRIVNRKSNVVTELSFFISPNFTEVIGNNTNFMIHPIIKVDWICLKQSGKLLNDYFQDLSKNELSENCLHGQTQNSSRTFNQVLWKRSTKTLFASKKSWNCSYFCHN